MLDRSLYFRRLGDRFMTRDWGLPTENWNDLGQARSPYNHTLWPATVPKQNVHLWRVSMCAHFNIKAILCREKKKSLFLINEQGSRGSEQLNNLSRDTQLVNGGNGIWARGYWTLKSTLLAKCQNFIIHMHQPIFLEAPLIL